jgi:NCS2 family nucleobase:cation symporter-2
MQLDTSIESDSVIHHPEHQSVHDDVDATLPTPRLALLGLQHVLVMYAGSVAVPLIVGHSLHFNAREIGMLISADLFACALATLIQTIGIPGSAFACLS